jgi:hypothetical protein
MQDVAAAMLSDFSARLSELIASSTANGGGPEETGAPAEAPQPAPPAGEPEALAVGGLVRRALLRRLRGLFAPRRRR